MRSGAEEFTSLLFELARGADGLAIADIPDDRQEMRVISLQPAERELDEELTSVARAGQHLDRARMSDDPSLPVFPISRKAGFVLSAQGFGDDRRERSSQHVSGGVAEERFSGGIPQNDRAFFDIADDHGIAHGGKEAADPEIGRTERRRLFGHRPIVGQTRYAGPVSATAERGTKRSVATRTPTRITVPPTISSGAGCSPRMTTACTSAKIGTR